MQRNSVDYGEEDKVGKVPSGIWRDSPGGTVVKNPPARASLVAQWFRVYLPMQGTRVRALVWEDPTCRGATSPVSHNYWACASGACAPLQEEPQRWEAHEPQWRVAPARRNWRKPSHRNEDPTQPKIKKKKKNPPVNAGDTGSSPGPGKFHMPSTATKPMRHNYRACVLEPVSHSYWARVPQLLKPMRLEPVLCNKRSHCNEKPVYHNKE